MIFTMMEACRETGMTYQGLKFCDSKQGFYDGVLSGAAEYVSNLLPCSCS